MTIDEDAGTEKMILIILKQNGDLSTAELVKKVSLLNSECADRIPMVLSKLKSEGKLKSEISKEKKAIIWSIL